MENKIRDGVAYVLEEGDVGRGEVLAGLKSSAEVVRTQVLSVRFATKLEYPQLQAADILAYETAKQTLRSAGKSSRRNLRKSLDRLLNAVSHRGEYCDAEAFSQLIPKLRQHAEQGKSLR